MRPVRLQSLTHSPILSGLMSLLVSCVATIRAVGLPPEFAMIWAGSWLSSWAIAFPAVLIVGPATHWLVERLFRAGGG